MQRRHFIKGSAMLASSQMPALMYMFWDKYLENGVQICTDK